MDNPNGAGTQRRKNTTKDGDPTMMGIIWVSGLVPPLRRSQYVRDTLLVVWVSVGLTVGQQGSRVCPLSIRGNMGNEGVITTIYSLPMRSVATQQTPRNRPIV